jgi:hypothetical protein
MQNAGVDRKCLSGMELPVNDQAEIMTPQNNGFPDQVYRPDLL